MLPLELFGIIYNHCDVITAIRLATSCTSLVTAFHKWIEASYIRTQCADFEWRARCWGSSSIWQCLRVTTRCTCGRIAWEAHFHCICWDYCRLCTRRSPRALLTRGLACLYGCCVRCVKCCTPLNPNNVTNARVLLGYCGRRTKQMIGIKCGTCSVSNQITSAVLSLWDLIEWIYICYPWSAIKKNMAPGVVTQFLVYHDPHNPNLALFSKL